LPSPYEQRHLFPFDARIAQCSCGSRQILGDLIARDMKLYDLNTCYIIQVVMGKCGSCRTRWFVTDLVDFGIFVWSSQTAFTHTLLNRYTIDFCNSETPFHAFAESQSDMYLDAIPAIKFLLPAPLKT
jgi:hypothetical protein